MNIKCAECQCAPEECFPENNNDIQCKNCAKPTCCCVSIHKLTKETNYSANHHALFFRSPFSSIIRYVRYAKGLYAAALGIEILCITAAEIGENTGLYLFGLNPFGITIAYVMGYTLAAFATFATILGRYNYDSNQKVCSCCSVLEQDSSKGFISNLKTTFKNFTIGIEKLPSLYKQPDLKNIIKTSLIILITAESICILTAETVDLIFYKYSILLSVPLALLAGAFTVVAPEAYRKTKRNRKPPSTGNKDFVSFSGFKNKSSYKKS